MEQFITIAIILILLSLLIFQAVSNAKVHKRNRIKFNSMKEKLVRYSSITNIEDEFMRWKEKLEKLQKEAQSLNEKYVKGKSILNQLESQIRIYEDDLDLISFGVYKPIFDFDASEDYKNKISQIVERQKFLIKNESAVICTTTWQVGGSVKQGEIMIRRYIKLALRAFNGECDSLIAKVKWNNITRFEERIRRAFDAINKLGKSNHVYITDEYLQLKVDELRLTHEYEMKKYEEKEEQKRIREQMREEEKAQRELEQAQKAAELEELRYQKALQQAQKELEKAQGEELNKLTAEIETLQRQLQEAHDVKERAISRAQMTKSGHVYVISNVGSFGDNIYKIGMTRRLEPEERVKELGDASVPFQFDIHAMIYSENAPELENIIHKAFDQKRLNLVNYRKEYFKVSLNDIEKVIRENTNSEIHFTKLAEAKEYRESISLLKQLNDQMEMAGKVKTNDYPETLFPDE